MTRPSAGAQRMMLLRTRFMLTLDSMLALGRMRKCIWRGSHNWRCVGIPFGHLLRPLLEDRSIDSWVIGCERSNGIVFVEAGEKLLPDLDGN